MVNSLKVFVRGWEIYKLNQMNNIITNELLDVLDTFKHGGNI